MSDALEAARRIVKAADNPSTFDEITSLDACTVARALLSLAQGREETIEECARVADKWKLAADQRHAGSASDWQKDREAARSLTATHIADEIRLLNSLPSKEGGGST
jgi:hypothetical protein